MNDININTMQNDYSTEIGRNIAYVRKCKESEVASILYCTFSAIYLLLYASCKRSDLAFKLMLNSKSGNLAGLDELVEFAINSKSTDLHNIRNFLLENIAKEDIKNTLQAIFTETISIEQAISKLSIVDQVWMRQQLHDELIDLYGYSYIMDGKDAVNILGDARQTVITTGEGNDIDVNYGVQYIINLYSDNNDTSPKDIESHVNYYLDWIISNYGSIDLRGIQRDGNKVISLLLDQVYVPLETEVFVDAPLDRDLYSSNETKVRKEITTNDLLGAGDRLVLIGGPGSGKTTVLLYLAQTLAYALRNNDVGFATQRLGFSENLPLPVYVPLSGYADYIKSQTFVAGNNDQSLVKYISYYLIREQASIGLPSDFFEKLISRGRSIILLLDGLDEVPDENNRLRVRLEIERIVSGLNKSIKTIVTCRTAAYEGRTAIGKGFQNINVLPLRQHHIESIIRSAYKEIIKNDAVQSTAKANNLLTAIDRFEHSRQDILGQEINRLIDSPLLVRMLLIVHYNNQQYLPEQRVELYRRATEILIYPDYTPYDLSQQIDDFIGGNKDILFRMFQYIAFKMHSLGENQGREITEDQFRTLLQENTEFAHLSEKFIGFIKIRSTLVEERLGMYRFIHLAFQEYLSARYIIQNNTGAQKIEEIIHFLLREKAFVSSWWREPILLLIGELTIVSKADASNLLRQLIEINRYMFDDNSESSVNTLIASVELGITASLEWVQCSKELRYKTQLAAKQCLHNSLAMKVSDPIWREKLSVSLAKIGDDRSEVNNVEDMPFCFVPEGEFWMGSDNGSPREKPLHKMQLNSYWISQHLITNSQYKQFIESGGYKNIDYWLEAKKARIWKNGFIQGYQQEEWMRELVRSWMEGERDTPSIKELPFSLSNHPVVGITWYEALAFTKWLTYVFHRKKLIPEKWVVALPSEAEWEKAARGGWTHPNNACTATLSNGMDFFPSCDLIKNSNNKRIYPWGFDKGLDIPNRLQFNFVESNIGSTSAIGCFPSGQSVYGCHDMSGNVFEWTRSSYRGYPYYDKIDERENLDLPSDKYRILRGGYFNGGEAWASCSFRKGEYPLINDKLTGFRVVLLALS